MKKNLPFYVLSALILALCLYVELENPLALQDKFESKIYDVRLRLRNVIFKPSPNPDIELVLIDEKSLAEIGRWPWSRGVMAGLVNKISAAKPKVIGIDIMFTEPESQVNDAKLADAIKKAGNVVLATPFELINRTDDQKAGPQLPDFLTFDSVYLKVEQKSLVDQKKDWAPFSTKAIVPLAELATVSTLGQVANQPDIDGVLRRELLSVRYDSDYFPSFSLQIARIASGLPMQALKLDAESDEVILGKQIYLTDYHGRVLINYRGKEGTYGKISASDLLNDRVPAEQLRNKIILLGTSALATYDIKVTPLSGNYPGVEKNATVVDNLLANDFIRKNKYIYFEPVCIVVTGLLFIFFLPRLNAKIGVRLAVGLIGFYTMLTWGLLIFANIWLNFLFPFLGMFSIAVVGIFSRWISEENYARDVRKMFSSYVTERLVTEMIAHPEMAQLGGHRQEITVLFSDVVSFTTYSENHQPEEVVAILNEYLGAMTDIVLKWEGILDKFIGDAIVVFWGAPMVQKDHAERAVRCALDMQERLEQLRIKWEAEGRAPLSSGIGLNTGEAIVGNIGAQGKKMDYTVIGDHVNLGARVEGLTRRYGAKILMTEYTLEKLRPTIDAGQFRGVSILGQERVIVKGKDTPVGIYAVNPLEPEAATVVVACDPERVVKLTEK